MTVSTPPEHKWGLTWHVSYLSGWANHDRISDTFVVVPAEGDVCLLFAGLPYMLQQIKEVSPIKDLRMVKAVDTNAVAVDTKSKTKISTIKSFGEETLSILDENKIEQVICLNFNSQFSRISAIDFISNILIKNLDTRYLVIGEDFKFGYDRGNGRLVCIRFTA